MTKRFVTGTDPRLLVKFAYNFGFKGMLSVQRFKRRIKRGVYFPPFLFISITNACNLRCKGCWVDVDGPRQAIDLSAMNRLIKNAKAHGNSFFGILGGEPFMHPQLLDILAAHPANLVRIPMLGDHHRSLNLAQAAAIGLYEALRQTENW